MQKVTETIQVAGNADAIWRDVGAFGSVGMWHPMLAKVDVQGEWPGALRTAETRDGQRQTERLLAIAHDRRRYRYALLSTPMPVTDYVAEFSVRENGDDTSDVCWSAEFHAAPADVAKTTELVRGFFRAGLENLAARYGRPGSEGEA